MRVCDLIAAGTAMSCLATAAQAMEIVNGESSEIVDIVGYFTRNSYQYQWLSEAYKELYSNLPSSLEFRKNWDGYQAKMQSLEQLESNQFKAIINKSKDFFKKYLGQNNILYDIACKVIDMGRYEESDDAHNLNDSEMFLDFDYLDNIRDIQYKASGSYENKNKMRKEAKEQMKNILQNYISDFAYRQEEAEELNLAEKPKEYEWEIYKRYKDKLRNFASENIPVDFFDDVVLPRMQKNYSYDLYQEILNETGQKYCTLHKTHKDEFDERWCECRKNFCNTHRIYVKYRGEAHLLSTTVHEAGHTIADAVALMMDEKHARLENIEAIAMYFETLLYEDEKYKDYAYVKIDRLYSLYADLAAIIGMEILKNNYGDATPIIGIKNLDKKEKIECVSANRELCTTAIEMYNVVARHMDEKIIYRNSGVADGTSSDAEQIVTDLGRIYDQFYTEQNDIYFDFGDHTKALFHAYKVREQAKQQNWDMARVLYELACAKMHMPTLEDFKDVVARLVE